MLLARLLSVYLLLATVAVPAISADKAPAKPFTQGEAARMIVKEFGWTGGLPKEPADRDYLVILGGKRTFRYEAESAYNAKTDRVTVREFNQFGPFTGKGWIMGVSDTTAANFTVLVPIGGTYTLKAVIKGNGFIWKINGMDLKADSNSGGFKEVSVGSVAIPPGVHQIMLTIPPQGAIDSFSFVAQDYQSIQPFAGWRFRDTLTAGSLAEIGVALAGTIDRLPSLQQQVPAPVAALDAARPSPEVRATSTDFLGSFKSKQWLRATFRGATLELPFKIAEPGYYIIRARILATTCEGDINGVPFSVAGKPYLDDVDLGLFRLDAGDNLLTLKLPPKGGLDRIEFGRKDTSSAEFMKLAGLSGPPDRPITAEEALNFFKGIHSSTSVRK